ncbi:hypothetical protein [Marinobacter sp. NSM]|uniref:hypothetical protein n=1 Tax=Marinobacter sp. NSM TaxID=3458004 RepID=UPI0040362799
MKKKAGPDLTPKRMETAPCPDCHRGFVQGVFHTMPCFTCFGVGRLQDGAPLKDDDAKVLLRMACNDLQDENRKLRLQIAELKSGEAGRGYGAGGSRYHGD